MADGRVAQRLRLALDMYEFGEEMQRSRLRRLRPDTTVDEIDAELGLPIATTGHLIALKLLARNDETRPQDLADLRALRAVATSADLVAARDAVQLISQRGFDRGRDLSAALAALEAI